ncbi:hypothetical protein FIM25_11065 [Desulfobotulus mexicanus]|uniref:Uncharacterized protein n=2 Tax=Desulfobotulus mexicanus TaxID=2586642 RepID=A0A5S5MF47_9BACT|nr:hypothetical protein FIM25_11065 [Desulfobotulus mexicanus]
MFNIGSDIKTTQIITQNVILFTPSSDQIIPAETLNPLIFSPQTASVVTELQEQFLDSIGSNLIQPEIIRSKIFSRIEDAIEKGQDILVHGPSGYGKSAVLHKLTQDLREKGIPCLPLRLDRRIPDKSARQYGMEMDLQGSPALALSAMAGEDKAVLILDQLDAIRWTAAHSSRAMDICKEMLRQVRALREQGKDRILVFACRTFDLENDPEIRAFLEGPEKEKFVKIAVEALAEEEIRGIIGPDFESLSKQQRRILAIPLHLSMWLKIREDGGQMPFQTATQLMRCFLENLRRTLEEKASVSAKEMDAFLKPLLDHMETRGEVSAPVGRLENSSTILLDKLISFGLLQKDRQRISFCHQRYLDYLVAERLLPRIYEGNGTVLTWLGIREQQSLFRREQLRQVLTLLTEESAPDFFSAAQNLLESPHVRFHMKHLVLEILGQLDAPSEEIRHYCLDLSKKDKWQGHMLETVFSGHAPWVRILLTSGSIQRWLSLSQEEEAFKALSLLRSVTDTLPDQVAETLRPFLHKGEDWPRRILNTLCWDEANDSDAMFALRLDLIRCGHMKSPVCWDSLGSKSPLRAVRLVETILSTWHLDTQGRLIRKENDDFKNWYRPDLQILKKTIAQCPEQGWKLLFPEIVRLTDIHPDPHDETRLGMWEKEGFYYRRPQTDFARGALEILIQAGKILLDEQTEFLLEELSSLEKSTSPVVQEILMSLYANLPSHHADVGIRWLLSDTEKFWLDSYAKKSKWGPAIRLIKKLSPHCSQGLFHELEETLIHYHSPQEKFNAEYFLKGWQHGNFGHYWGRTQKFLLLALDSSRIKASTRDLIRVLKRKFREVPEATYFRSGATSGGFIGSKLTPNLEKISDSAWLRIVSSKKVTKKDNLKWIQKNSEHVLTTSINQFAASLSSMARRFPERFVKLALRFPPDTHPAYFAAILEGFTYKPPAENKAESQQDSWSPAQIKNIEAFLVQHPPGEDEAYALLFCRMLRERADEPWQEKTLSHLIHYATQHPDPRMENEGSDGTKVHHLDGRSLNCVRGVAADAIGRILSKHGDCFEIMRPAIEALVRDPHPAVRMAAIKAIEPVMNIDRDLAARWFSMACEGDPRIAASPHGLPLFNALIPGHTETVGHLIPEMAFSSFQDVAFQGARQVAGRWLFWDFFEEELSQCRNGTLAQRRGVAHVAASFIHDIKHFEKCKDLLLQFMNDGEKEVRNELRNIFREGGLLERSEAIPFIRAYIRSQAFDDSFNHFIRDLKEFKGDLVPLADIIFAVFEEIPKILKEKRSHQPYPSQEMPGLLLRLYEQSQEKRNHSIALRCLDIWDLFFEERIAGVIGLTKNLEQ